MNSRTGIAFALMTLMTATGCTSFEMTRLRNHIDREVPQADVGEGFALSFGRLTMGTARTALALSDDNDESTAMARAMLRNVRKVQVGKYEVHGHLDLGTVSTPSIFDAYERKGWIPVATVREPDEAVWIMAKEKHDDLRDLLVVVLSTDELIVAKMSGNLTEAVTAAMAESDWASNIARSLNPSPDSVAAAPQDDAFHP